MYGIELEKNQNYKSPLNIELGYSCVNPVFAIVYDSNGYHLTDFSLDSTKDCDTAIVKVNTLPCVVMFLCENN